LEYGWLVVVNGYIYIYINGINGYKSMESGWWLTYPSEKYEFEWKVIKFMFQTTNQMGLSENDLHPQMVLLKGKMMVDQW